jgi:hypothetical protein
MDRDRYNPKQVGGGWESWLSICCILLIFISLGVAYYVYTDMQNKKYVKTEQVLEKNTSYLIYDTNFPIDAKECVPNKTYGINNNGQFYVSDGCSGIFLYHDANDVDHIGICTSSDLSFKKCDFGQLSPDVSPYEIKSTGDDINPLYSLSDDNKKPPKTNLNGFVNKTDDVIKIISQNGKCTPDNYGFFGNNKIYTEGGCSGTFRIGPLVGECGSTGSTPSSEPKHTQCPIGYKELIDGKHMGLVLTELRAEDTRDMCQSGDNAYGYRDANTGFRDINACQDGMAFTSDLQDNALYANFPISCDASESDCDLNL